MKSTLIVASAALALPAGQLGMLHAQQPTPVAKPAGRAPASASLVLKYPQRADKWPARSLIVGIDNGNAIYQNERGEQFTLDPRTGDMAFISAEEFAKFSERMPRPRAGTPLRMIKWGAWKFPGELVLLGTDQAGHVIHQNERGEKFYLDPVTADMVFVK